MTLVCCVWNSPCPWSLPDTRGSGSPTGSLPAVWYILLEEIVRELLRVWQAKEVLPQKLNICQSLRTKEEFGSPHEQDSTPACKASGLIWKIQLVSAFLLWDRPGQRPPLPQLSWPLAGLSYSHENLSPWSPGKERTGTRIGRWGDSEQQRKEGDEQHQHVVCPLTAVSLYRGRRELHRRQDPVSFHRGCEKLGTRTCSLGRRKK